MGSKHWCFTLHADQEQSQQWASLEPGSEAPLILFDAGVMDYMLYQVEACLPLLVRSIFKGTLF